MTMERSWCRGGGADWKLRKTNTCTSDGSTNNSKHSQRKSGNFIIEMKWERCFTFATWLN